MESLSPHRVLGVDENDELIDPNVAETGGGYGEKQSFAQMILENLKTAGVQQAHKEDKITFTALKPWPGDWSAPKGATSKATRKQVLKSARLFSLVQSLAPSHVPIW